MSYLSRAQQSLNVQSEMHSFGALPLLYLSNIEHSSRYAKLLHIAMEDEKNHHKILT